MSALDLMPPALRGGVVALVFLLVAGLAAGGAWAVQDWRYGQALAEQGRKAAEAAADQASAAAARAEAVTATLVIE